MKRYLQLNDITAYKKALGLSNYIWNIVVKWDYFAKSSIGIQFTKAVDSISANLAEGFGRYTKRDKINFYRISYGSLKESLDWNEKAKIRNLITNEQYNYILTELNALPLDIHHLINYTENKLTI